MYSENYSCGPEPLETKRFKGYTEVEGSRAECGFYLKELWEMGVQNSATNGVLFVSAFSRKFS